VIFSTVHLLFGGGGGGDDDDGDDERGGIWSGADLCVYLVGICKLVVNVQKKKKKKIRFDIIFFVVVELF